MIPGFKNIFHYEVLLLYTTSLGAILGKEKLKDTPRTSEAWSLEVTLVCRQLCSYPSLKCADKYALVLSL